MSQKRKFTLNVPKKEVVALNVPKKEVVTLNVPKKEVVTQDVSKTTAAQKDLQNPVSSPPYECQLSDARISPISIFFAGTRLNGGAGTRLNSTGTRLNSTGTRFAFRTTKRHRENAYNSRTPLPSSCESVYRPVPSSVYRQSGLRCVPPNRLGQLRSTVIEKAHFVNPARRQLFPSSKIDTVIKRERKRNLMSYLATCESNIRDFEDSIAMSVSEAPLEPNFQLDQMSQNHVPNPFTISILPDVPNPFISNVPTPVSHTAAVSHQYSAKYFPTVRKLRRPNHSSSLVYSPPNVVNSPRQTTSCGNSYEPKPNSSTSTKRKEIESSIPFFVYIRYLRVSSIVVLVDYIGGPVKMERMEFKFDSFIQQRKLLHSWSRLLRKYFRRAAFQAASTMMNRTFRGLVAHRWKRRKPKKLSHPKLHKSITNAFHPPRRRLFW